MVIKVKGTQVIWHDKSRVLTRIIDEDNSGSTPVDCAKYNGESSNTEELQFGDGDGEDEDVKYLYVEGDSGIDLISNIKLTPSTEKMGLPEGLVLKPRVNSISNDPLDYVNNHNELSVKPLNSEDSHNIDDTSAITANSCESPSSITPDSVTTLSDTGTLYDPTISNAHVQDKDKALFDPLPLLNFSGIANEHKNIEISEDDIDVVLSEEEYEVTTDKQTAVQ